VLLAPNSMILLANSRKTRKTTAREVFQEITNLRNIG
jgi:hypothetical protein